MTVLEKQDSRSDEELFEAWRRGETASFENLLARYQGRLYKVILGWTRNPHLSQDLFQETWTRVIEHLEDFDRQRRFSPWVFSIALNLTRDHFRKEGRNKTDADTDAVEATRGETDMDQRLVEKEQAARLSQALASLSDLEREVFMLRHFSGLSFRQIAAMLKINLNTALSRMHQALDTLKKTVGEEL